MNLTDIARVQLIREKAIELGFADIGFSKAEYLENDAPLLDHWLAQGSNAGMQYMANHREKRLDPTLLVEGAQTVISLLSLYNQDYPTSFSNSYRIARYAFGKDYHDVIKDKLHALMQYMKENLFPKIVGRAFVDSAPVLERSWAQKSGLGWIGKNTNLIHPRLGSYVFISELIVNEPIEDDRSLVNYHCGSCQRCIDACPTSALTPHYLDANKCISYLTIEHKGDIPNELSGKFQNRIFGCDICQEVCPWNRKSPLTNESSFFPSESLHNMKDENWENLSASEFTDIFKNSPIKRSKHEGLMRNISFVRNQK